MPNFFDIAKKTETQLQPEDRSTMSEVSGLGKNEVSGNDTPEKSLENSIGKHVSEELRSSDYYISDMNTAVISEDKPVTPEAESFFKSVADKFSNAFESIKMYTKDASGQVLAQDIKDKGELYQGLKKIAAGGAVITSLMVASKTLPIPLVGTILSGVCKGAAIGGVGGMLLDGSIGFAKAVKDGADINVAIERFVNKGGSGALIGATAGGVFGGVSKAAEISTIAAKTGATMKEVAGIQRAGGAIKNGVIEGAASAVNKVEKSLGSGKNYSEIRDESINIDVKQRAYSEDLIKNKLDGLEREQKVETELMEKYSAEKGSDILSEVYLRDKNGNIVKDSETGEARRIDFMVIRDGTVIDSIEVTSLSADKTDQIAKENRIRVNGGSYIKDDNGNLIKIPDDVLTRIERRE